MDTSEVLTAINERIEVLTRVKALLAGGEDAHSAVGYAMTGWPIPKPRTKAKRVMSPQGRANIAAARRKRAKLEAYQAKIGHPITAAPRSKKTNGYELTHA